MIKAIISIEIMQSAIVLFFVTINFQVGAQPPIGVGHQTNVSDPLPQALMLTAIVIGVAVTAVSLAMLIAIQHKYGTTDWQELIKKRRELGS
ncbi:NADH-ubiquinone oxidoreductase, chain 4L [Alkaliphilus metalliredigens QYMF]|uniref:NADH-ubiquinone oxidoreductase, chain 4L n=2 Tax=Alkaliphilus TaxID=114627 RepID=A6TME1_ALKMQ|nr:NADH-ubiquinone oxidoreductase, chain 4L [Alkaliphilus metalliredigens QYMF]